MELYVNNALVDGSPLQDETIEQTLHKIQAGLDDRGHVVVGFQRDGRQIPSDEVEQAMREPVASCDRLDVFTAPPSELVVDAMSQASKTLHEVTANMAEVANLLAQGQAEEGIRLLGKCVGVWQQIHDALAKSIQMIGLEEKQVEIDDVPLGELMNKPRELLSQIIEALQSQDHVLLADILQYEFEEVTNIWQRIIAHIGRLAEDNSLSLS